nr:zinc knuckle CX2CX4HX4C [Tanacetum cinerariifolium]
MGEGIRAGVTMVNDGDDMGVSCVFVANNSSHPEGGIKSNVDTRTTGADWQHDGVLEHGPWLIRNAPFILRKWIPIYGLSAIATRLGTPVMLDLCTVTTCMQSWGRIDYARALVDIRVDRALKDTMVISVPKSN